MPARPTCPRAGGPEGRTGPPSRRSARAVCPRRPPAGSHGASQRGRPPGPQARTRGGAPAGGSPSGSRSGRSYAAGRDRRSATPVLAGGRSARTAPSRARPARAAAPLGSASLPSFSSASPLSPASLRARWTWLRRTWGSQTCSGSAREASTRLESRILRQSSDRPASRSSVSRLTCRATWALVPYSRALVTRLPVAGSV